ncbi:HTH domain-containing protein [Stigmatella erecta]|uniref:Restriction endonuclease n=1 Tax=Stigmatella erecta TaxID=83460 RepID=A0A1H9Z6Q9_9BACT|nr:restriction endonuclease [Stigmatella erecta]SES77193.1 Restriction endonuclease [Stigmatella erecta]
MTFYEAALRILESEGRPLHFLEITEKSIAQNLLSHVGKTPEITMLSRLAAMARRTRDRKVVVTSKDTFALVDWALQEDLEALAQTGVVEPNPEEDLPPLRPAERHPEPRTDNVRATGRGSERKRRREDDEERGGRKRRFPPLPEVVFEILSEAEAGLRAEQLIERARSRELAPEDITVEAVLTALLEDNQRRIDAGRRPQFSFNKQSSEVSLERAGSPSEAPPLELQAAFAAALGIPLEGGRPLLARPAAAAGTAEALVDPAQLATLKATLKDVRRSVARGLRKRLGELEVGTFEKSVVKMMHALHFRELKVAKRSKEGPLLTARKREGSVELRYAVRLLKGTSTVDRKMVQELRRDLGHYSAQVGLLVSAGEARGDARTEAQASGALVMLWCGDALGEKFLEAKTAVSITQVELFDIDERFFEAAKLDADEAQRRREERQREKQTRGEPGGKEASSRRGEESEEDKEQVLVEEPKPIEAEVRESSLSAVPPPPPPEDEDQGEEGDDEGEDEDLEAASAFVGGTPEGGASAEGGTPAERKRRRRRRRGRRGRGNKPEAGAPGAAPAGEAAPEGAPAAGIVAAAEAASAEAAPPTGEATAPAEEAAPPAGEAPAAEEPPPAPPTGGGSSEGGTSEGNPS